MKHITFHEHIALFVKYITYVVKHIKFGSLELVLYYSLIKFKHILEIKIQHIQIDDVIVNLINSIE